MRRLLSISIAKASNWGQHYHANRSRYCASRRYYLFFRIRDDNLAKRGIDANNIEEQVR